MKLQFERLEFFLFEFILKYGELVVYSCSYLRKSFELEKVTKPIIKMRLNDKELAIKPYKHPYFSFDILTIL
jgi:hypothetical protein